MRGLILILILCPCLTGTALAQTVELRVIDAVTRRPISDVVGLGSDATVQFQTDSAGAARLTKSNAPYVLRHVAYHSQRINAVGDSGVVLVTMQPLATMLKGVEVLSPITRYRRERAFNRQFFRKELAGAKFKPGKKMYVSSGTPMGLMIGVEWSGVLAECASRASGKKARYRRFARELRSLEGRKLAAIRYTTALVSEQTGLDETAARAFIAANELSEEYLFNASDLELKMHIRELFRASHNRKSR